MTDLDKLNLISGQLAEILEKYKPYDACDPNIRMHGALSLAKDQVDFAAHLLHKREPDPRQESMFQSVHREGDVVKGSVIITSPEVPWCSVCDNPKVACTC